MAAVGKDSNSSVRWEHPDVSEHLAHRAPEPAHQVQPDQPIGRPDGVAPAGVGHPIGHGLDINNDEARINGDADEQIVNGITGPAYAGSNLVIGFLEIGDTGIQVKEAVIAEEPLNLDSAGMDAGASAGGFGKGHGSGKKIGLERKIR
jgi:hypothetical protein